MDLKFVLAKTNEEIESTIAVIIETIEANDYDFTTEGKILLTKLKHYDTNN